MEKGEASEYLEDEQNKYQLTVDLKRAKLLFSGNHTLESFSPHQITVLWKKLSEWNLFFFIKETR